MEQRQQAIRFRGLLSVMTASMLFIVLAVGLFALTGSVSQGVVVAPELVDEDDRPMGEVGAASEWPLEVGVEYVANYPGTSSDLPNAAGNGWGVYLTLKANGWCNFVGNDCYIWGNANAWEEDFKRHDLGGNNDNWVDNVDLVFYEGHGNSSLFTFKTPTGGGTHDDSYLTYNDARLAWGNKDAEWIALLSCSVLADSHELDWVWTMNRLHLLMGFENTAYDVGGFGTKFAQYVAADYRIALAWMKACDQKQPAGVRAKILAEEYHHFWDRRNYQYPDNWDNDYYRWEHACGSEPARYVDVTQLQTMPIFSTPALDLAEANRIWGNITGAFEVPTQTVAAMQGEDYFVSTSDGRELEMDVNNGLFYYVDHNNLFSPTMSVGVQAISAQQAQDIANQFLTSNGLMPADAQFYEVVTETLEGVAMPGRTMGALVGDAQVMTSTLAAHQVIYSRILSYTPPGASAQQAQEFSVVGPGGKLKVYVAPSGGQVGVAQNGGPGAILGAQGGWRSVEQPAGLQVQATVDILPFDQINQLFLQLEPQVALEEVPFDNPTHKEVLTYTVGYWEESTGQGQDQLYPAYVLEARYEGTLPGTTDPYVVTDTTYIPSNETYMRPLAEIVSNSDVSANLMPGDVFTATAADASMPLNQLGYHASLNFVLGSGGPYLYDWYLGSVAPENKIGSGRDLTYMVEAPMGSGHDGPVSQTVILVVTDTGSAHSSQNTNTDSVAFTSVPPVYLPATIKNYP